MFFLEFPCLLCDPVNVGNLISGSSALSKPSLYIWKFLVQVLLKPSLKHFEHNLTSMWNERSCVVVWIFFVIALLHGSQICHCEGTCITQWSYEPCHSRPPKIDGSQRRVLIKCGPLEERMANHCSILASRIPWTILHLIYVSICVNIYICKPTYREISLYRYLTQIIYSSMMNTLVVYISLLLWIVLQWTQEYILFSDSDFNSFEYVLGGRIAGSAGS